MSTPETVDAEPAADTSACIRCGTPTHSAGLCPQCRAHDRKSAPVKKISRYIFRFVPPLLMLMGLGPESHHIYGDSNQLTGPETFAAIGRLIHFIMPWFPPMVCYVVGLFGFWNVSGYILDTIMPRTIVRRLNPPRWLLPATLVLLVSTIGLTVIAFARDWYLLSFCMCLLAQLCGFLLTGLALERRVDMASHALDRRRRRRGIVRILAFSALLTFFAVSAGLFTQSAYALPLLHLVRRLFDGIGDDAHVLGIFFLLGPVFVLLDLLAIRIGMYLSIRAHLAAGEELIWDETPLTATVRKGLGSLSNPRNWRLWLATVLLLWCSVCILVQDSTLGSRILIASLVIGYLLVCFVPAAYRWALMATFLLATVLAKMGSYHLFADVALLLCTLAVALAWFSRTQPGRWRQTRFCAATVVVTWLLWSAGDAMHSTTAAPHDPHRFASYPQQSPLAKGKHIGIALSGGGYRATLMHAGVLDGLERIGLRPTHISAVSGGSITGAYYAIGGPPDELRQAFEERRILLYRDLIDAQNLVRMIFPAHIPGTTVALLPFYQFSTTRLNAQVLNRVFFANAELRDLPSTPKLMVDMTALNSGRAIGTTPTWLQTRFLLRPPGEDSFPNATNLYTELPRLSRDSTFDPRDMGSQRLSDMVAASAAFPLAFEPLPVDLGKLGRFLFSDGGITDNSAMTLLLEADRRASLEDPAQGDPAWSLDLAISSDGGSMFTQADDKSMQGVGRAIDIIDARIGLQLPTGAKGKNHPELPQRVLLSPSLYVDNSRNDIDFNHFAIGYKALGDVPYFYATRFPLNDYDLGENSNQIPLNEAQLALIVLARHQLYQLDDTALPLLYKVTAETRDWFGPLTPVPVPFARDTKQFSVFYHLPDYFSPGTKSDSEDSLYMSHLAGLLMADFSQCLETFLNTPTLQDSFTSKQARELFRLGQYLVLLNEPELRSALQNPAQPPAANLLFTKPEKAHMDCDLENAVYSDLTDKFTADQLKRRVRNCMAAQEFYLTD